MLHKTVSEVENLLIEKYGKDISQVATLAKQGQWSQVFGYRQGAMEYVIKFSNLKDNFLRDEFACQFSSSSMPIPEVLEVSACEGGYYAILTKAKGKHIDILTKDEMTSVFPAVLDLFEALSQADVSNTSGYGGWDEKGNGVCQSWKEYLLNINNETKEKSIQKLRQSNLGDTAFKQIYQQLEAMVKYCPEERHLIHGDLLYYNVLVEGERISTL